METFHRLAGVQDASDFGSAQPAQLVSTTDSYAREPSIAHDQDGDVGMSSQSNRASRASLPLNRQSSRKSLRNARDENRTAAIDAPPTPRLNKFSSNPSPHPAVPRLSHETGPADTAPAPLAHHSTRGDNGDDDDTDIDDGGFAWGPTHPCFPHPNPHCHPRSPEHRATRVIRVRRDWLVAGDLYPQYANLYPEILDPLVGDADFRFLIATVNAICKRAFAPFALRAWVESVLGMLTGYLWEDLGLTGTRRAEAQLERFINRWNAARREEGKDVRVVQLKTTAFMSLDFVIPDPGIDAVLDEQTDIGSGIGPAV